jgi:hypothetical protein
MKKLFVLLLIFTPIEIAAQYQTTIKCGLSKDIIYEQYIIGADIGQISNDEYYTIMDFAFPLSKNAPGYMNIGIGPMFNKNFYVIGFIGLYSPNKITLRFNTGIEIGVINKNVIVSTFINNNQVIGIKIGYILKHY